MSIDREVQRAILKALEAEYPEGCDDLSRLGIADDRVLFSNLAYLEGHGLVENSWREFVNAPRMLTWSQITVRGIDFLADDGGLGAILGVVTVRFEGDELRRLLLDRVERSEAPPAEKSAIRKAIEALPAEGLKTVSTEALKAALPHLPDAIRLMRTWIGL